MTTTNFPDGVTNAALNSALTDMIAPDPTLLNTFFTDFGAYDATSWVVTETQAGATEALTAGAGGLLLITNSAADNDLVGLQTLQQFPISATKRAWFSCRFQVSDATQSDIQFGIVIVDTTPLDATDGIYFQKDDGAATIDIYVRKNTTTGSNKKSSIATLVTDTMISLQWYYDGAGRVFYGVNGTLVGSMDASSTYFPDATNLTASILLQNGEAVAKTMTIDYILASVER